MFEKIKELYKQTRKDLQPEHDRINVYWDKKTLFVHRRALLTGVILGGFLGADFVCFLVYLLITHDVSIVIN